MARHKKDEPTKEQPVENAEVVVDEAAELRKKLLKENPNLRIPL